MQRDVGRTRGRCNGVVATSVCGRLCVLRLAPDLDHKRAKTVTHNQGPAGATIR